MVAVSVFVFLKAQDLVFEPNAINADRSESTVGSLASIKSAPGLPPTGTVSFNRWGSTTTSTLSMSSTKSKWLESNSSWSFRSTAGSITKVTTALSELIPLRNKSLRSILNRIFISHGCFVL